MQLSHVFDRNLQNQFNLYCLIMMDHAVSKICEGVLKVLAALAPCFKAIRAFAEANEPEKAEEIYQRPGPCCVETVAGLGTVGAYRSGISPCFSMCLTDIMSSSTFWLQMFQSRRMWSVIDHDIIHPHLPYRARSCHGHVCGIDD